MRGLDGGSHTGVTALGKELVPPVRYRKSFWLTIITRKERNERKEVLHESERRHRKGCENQKDAQNRLIRENSYYRLQLEKQEGLPIPDNNTQFLLLPRIPQFGSVAKLLLI